MTPVQRCLVAALLVLGAGCAQDPGSDEVRTLPTEVPTTADPSPHDADVGPASDSSGPVTAPAVEGAPSPAGPSPPAPSPAGTGEVTVVNRSVEDHDSGLRLSFVVADKLVFDRSERIDMELAFENVSDRSLFHDSNQRHVFSIVSPSDPELWWTDESCRSRGSTGPPPTGVLELEPGEAGAFFGSYPADHVPGSPTDEDACRLPPGEYLAYGHVDWCPEHALVSPGGGPAYCDPDGTVPVRSAPLRIEIR